MSRSPPPPAISDRVVFLVNPASDNGATGRRWPELAHQLAQAGLAGDALFSEQPRAPDRAGAATRRTAGATLLVVVGGDGSVNEAAQALAGREGVDLAVLPRGTGTDFVREFGIPTRPAEAAAVALGGRMRTLDLGRVTYRAWAGGEAVGWFANVASAGMSGAIAKRTNESSKAMGGKASYLLVDARRLLPLARGRRHGDASTARPARRRCTT